MSYPSPRIRELILRLLKKEASDAELTEVQQWLKSDPKNLQYFDEINTSFQQENFAGNLQGEKLSAAWRRMAARISKEEAKPKQTNYARVFAMAASFLLIALAAWFIFTQKIQEHPLNHIVTNSSPTRMQVVLPDSTTVWLNVNSSIEYSDKFSTLREVHLRGEAFFDVTKKLKQSFTVKTPLFSIEVKGTRFNVQAYESEVKKATLEEGEIELKIHSSKEIYAMAPGDQILIDNNQQTIVRKKVDTESFTAWKESELVFDNTPLAEIITRLENRFRVEIRIDSTLAQRERFTMNIQDQTIEDILEMIHLSSNLSYKIENNIISIYE